MSLFGDALKYSLGHVALVGSVAAAIGVFGGYLYWHHAIYAEGYNACKAEVAEVTAQAKQDVADRDKTISDLAKQAQPELAKKVAAQQKLVDKLMEDAKHPPHAFTKDCTLPAEQVAAYNGIR